MRPLPAAPPAPSTAAPPAVGRAGRPDASALLRSLNDALMSHHSATATLERWCVDHGLAEPVRIVADRDAAAVVPAGDEQRRLLAVGPDEPVRFRRVRLRCGALVLSEADNWYVPARLTPAMNRLLDAGDTPFGRAVAALRFARRTLSAEPLWHPPPGAGAGSAVPAAVLRHRAVLVLPDGTPVAALVETYGGAVLDVGLRPAP